jgi:hypothetical protein
VFENRALRRIFGPKWDEEWRKLHSVELHSLFLSPDIIRWKNQDDRGVWGMGEGTNVYRVLVGKPVWKTKA